MPDGTPTKRRRRTSAPGQFLGYSLQELRFAAHLFRAERDEDVVSLEIIGDTGIHNADGRLKSEEHKSRTSHGNPVANDAPDLWKTLRIWVDAVSQGDLDPARTTFCLHLSRDFDGAIVRSFDEATTLESASEALGNAAHTVFRAPDGRSLVETLPQRTREHVLSVFSADRQLVVAVVAKFVLEFGSGDAWADLRQAASVAAFEPDLLDDGLRDAVGWVKQQITERLQQGRPAAISALSFRTHFRAIRRRLDNQLVLRSAAPGPDAVAIQRQLRAVQTYLRQLDLIAADDDEKLEAANDYLRATNDRVAWAASGRVHQASFDEFEADLETAWRRKKRAGDIVHRDHPHAQRGMLLYLECCNHSATLNGMEPPNAFCRGSFHALADHLRIGWHPDYSRLLRTRRVGRAGSDR
jgi:hypothetical protein